VRLRTSHKTIIFSQRYNISVVLPRQSHGNTHIFGFQLPAGLLFCAEKGVAIEMELLPGNVTSTLQLRRRRERRRMHRWWWGKNEMEWNPQTK
jgi:hypothetical protein